MPLQTSTWLLMSLPTFTKQGSQVLYLHTHPSDGQQTLYKCSFVTHIRHPKLHTLSLCTHLPLHSHCINPCLCAYAGAVLCFLPGWQDIKAVQQKLEETPSFRSGSQMILPCKRLVCVSSARLTDMRQTSQESSLPVCADGSGRFLASLCMQVARQANCKNNNIIKRRIEIYKRKKHHTTVICTVLNTRRGQK